MSEIKKNEPTGDLISRTVAMPANTNANGDIFGGWILSLMDLSGGIVARDCSGSRVVTIAVNTMSFLHPVHVADIVSCFAKVQTIGRTSMKVAIEVWVDRHLKKQRLCVTEGLFTYVAVDAEGTAIAVKKSA